MLFHYTGDPDTISDQWPTTLGVQQYEHCDTHISSKLTEKRALAHLDLSLEDKEGHNLSLPLYNNTWQQNAG